MKTIIRILAVGAVVLVIALGAWNAVFAEKVSSAARPAFKLSNILAPIMQGSSAAGIDSAAPSVSETPQAGDDNPAGTETSATAEAEHAPEASGTPEAGDDSQVQHESSGAAEANGELVGTVTAIDATTVTIDGKVFTLTSGAEVASSLQIGDSVKVEFVTNPDGTLSVREVKASLSSDESAQSGNAEPGDDSSPGQESGSKSGGGSDDGGHHKGGGDDGGSGGHGGGSGG